MFDFIMNCRLMFNLGLSSSTRQSVLAWTSILFLPLLLLAATARPSPLPVDKQTGRDKGGWVGENTTPNVLKC
jgi:hypothetical protein